MSIRTERVARLLQKEIAVLLQTDFFEPSQSIATVTRVRVTPDLSIAYVYVSVMGDEAQRNVGFKRIEEQLVQIRRALAARIRHQLRIVPELRLIADDSPEFALKMEGILSEIQKERDEKGEIVVDESVYPNLKPEDS